VQNSDHMRRSICLTEPHVALAGQTGTWKFSYSPAANLPKGTKLKFDMMLQNRPTDWEIPEVSGKENLLWLKTPQGKTHTPEEIELPNQPFPAFEFTLDSEVKAGEVVDIFLGTPGNDQDKGSTAQTVSQRRRPFYLYVDTKGKGDYKDPETFTIDVKGGEVETIRILTPSLVSKNRRFDIIVRFEDAHGNLTSNAPEGTLIELSYQHLRENLNWKLFVPETGFIVLPNLYFNETGVYRIELKTSPVEKKFYSAPIKCLPDTDYSIYWGLLHGESEKIDATEGIETYMRTMRDEMGLHFVASSPFESPAETPNDVWKSISAQVAERNEETRFTSFLGLQWFGDEDEGLRQLIYAKDNKPLMRKKDAKYTNLKKIYKIHNPKDVLSIPCFTMAKGFETDFKEFSPEFERVVEIYNAWGCSECTEAEGNLRPIKSLSKNGIQETAVGSIRKALDQNHRFGFVAGGLDDRGIYEGLFESDQVQYSPGLTGIIAVEQTRDTLLHALSRRSCYATTGARIVLELYIAGSQIGTELSTQNKPGLLYNRHITGSVCGTAPIKNATIFRNGKELHTMEPNDINLDFEYDDLQDLSQIALNSPDERPPFVYYYLRVVQEDGHIAWSSPIWVDLTESISTPQKKAKKK